MSEVSEAGREFIAHFGVKGMKWGVRNERRAAKKVAKKDAKFEKNAATIDTYIKIHNAAGKHFNENIGALNKRYPMDLTKHENRVKRDAYDREAEDLMLQSYQKGAKEFTNASGTRTYRVERDDQGGLLFGTEAIKHAMVTAFKAILDETGHIKKVYVPEDSMTQSEEFISGLMHYGVKGMRWGVRSRSMGAQEVTTQSVINAGLRSKTKVKAKGGEAHPATDDAIKAAIQKQKLKKSGPAALSNQELRDLTTRLELEQRAKVLAAPTGKKFVTGALKSEGQQQLQRGIREGTKAAGERARR